MIVNRDPLTPITASEWELLRRRYPDAHRLDRAFRLASTIETCATLLAGEPVHRDLLAANGFIFLDDVREAA